MSTKERIMEVAIDLFAESGFNDVSIRQITRAVGIKESSLYNHFSSKQQILDEIFDFLVMQYDKMNISEDEAVRLIEKMNPQEFMDMCLMNFQMYFSDPKLMKIWRIISIERFRNERANQFFIAHLIDNPLKYQSAVFASMMSKGLIKNFEPMVIARAFYSFILFIYMRYFEVNPEGNPAQDPELQKMIIGHMKFLSEAISKSS